MLALNSVADAPFFSKEPPDYLGDGIWTIGLHLMTGILYKMKFSGQQRFECAS